MVKESLRGAESARGVLRRQFDPPRVVGGWRGAKQKYAAGVPMGIPLPIINISTRWPLQKRAEDKPSLIPLSYILLILPFVTYTRISASVFFCFSFCGGEKKGSGGAYGIRTPTLHTHIAAYLSYASYILNKFWPRCLIHCKGHLGEISFNMYEA